MKILDFLTGILKIKIDDFCITNFKKCIFKESGLKVVQVKMTYIYIYIYI